MRKGMPESAGEQVPNLAPMVDIIMVILVFFMLGASINLATEGVLKTELDPRSGPSQGAAVEINPVIRIALENAEEGKSCNIYVMGDPLSGNSFDGLRSFMAQKRQAGADPSNPVVIAPESAVRWKFVVRAMDAAVRAGFKNVQFAVSFSGDQGGK